MTNLFAFPETRPVRHPLPFPFSFSSVEWATCVRPQVFVPAAEWKCKGMGLGWDPFGFLLFLQHLTLIWLFAKLSCHFWVSFPASSASVCFFRHSSRVPQGRGLPQCCFWMQCTINSQLAFCFRMLHKFLGVHKRRTLPELRGVCVLSWIYTGYIHLSSLPNQR